MTESKKKAIKPKPPIPEGGFSFYVGASPDEGDIYTVREAMNLISHQFVQGNVVYVAFPSDDGKQITLSDERGFTRLMQPHLYGLILQYLMGEGTKANSPFVLSWQPQRLDSPDFSESYRTMIYVRPSGRKGKPYLDPSAVQFVCSRLMAEMDHVGKFLKETENG